MAPQVAVGAVGAGAPHVADHLGAYFRTSVQFLPTLTRQRDLAQQRGQTERAALFDGLIQRLDEPSERN